VEIVRVELQPLIKSEQFDKIRSEFKQLLEKNPSNDVLGAMHLLVSLFIFADFFPVPKNNKYTSG